jgi:hypothetical protein
MLAVVLLGGWATLGPSSILSAQIKIRPVHATPPADCTAHVGFDREATLPGYLLGSPATCVPFTATAADPPQDYVGDYYVTEFSEMKLKERWLVCKADRDCRTRVERQMERRLPPLKQTSRSTGALDAVGKIATEGAADLRLVRRPSFFARGAHPEEVGEAEGRTYTIEFVVPPDRYEYVKLRARAPVRLRGWYMRGVGIDDHKRGRIRALIIMSNGGGGQMTAINDPADHAYHIDSETGEAVPNHFPNATSEAIGQRLWRQYLYDLNHAGFDVLSFDRRGEGISGGIIDTNTFQQGRDLLTVIDHLDKGRGLRVLTPRGSVRRNRLAANTVLGTADPGRIPIVLGGYSRASMAVGWAMTRNFAKICNYERSVPKCGPPLRRRNIRGAILIASFVGGAGYLPASTRSDDQDRNLLAGGLAQESNIIFFPGSEILASIKEWPAAFFARGCGTPRKVWRELSPPMIASRA